jgi:hypothetical protein
VSCRVFAAVVLAGLGLACGRGAAHVTSVRASVGLQEEALRAAGLDRAALERCAREELAAAGFRLGEGRRSYRARLGVVSVSIGRGGEAGPVAEMVVELELEPLRADRSASTLVETGTGVVRIDPRKRQEAWRDALGAAVRQASAGLALAFSEEAKPAVAIVTDLGSDNPRVREEAIRVLGDRRSVEAIPSLIERLRDPDPLLAERAAGALAQIGDPRAVGPLIDYSRRRDDGAYTARFARIVGDIGGGEARGYLQTLESGHPDARVREAAREALQELDARERERAGWAGKQGAPGGDSGRMTR